VLSEIVTTVRKVREFRRNERLPRPQFEALRLERFRRLARHVDRHSPYYAQIIRERGIDVDRCVPGDFPLLTKSMLMANFDRIVTDRRITKHGVTAFLARSTDPNELFLDRYHVVHTSGSSGEVGYFVYSHGDWARGRAQGHRSRGVPPKQKKGLRRYRMAFYGATGGHYVGVSMMSAAKRGTARFVLDVGIFEVNSPLPGTIEQLNAFQPDFIHGYTNALKVLAGKQREGALRLTLGGIEAGGEGMSPADKALLEDAFGCEAFSRYGCTEHLLMGVSIAGSSSMMLYDDDLIYEFYDDHSVVTNLFNYTLPLIRYRMSDILRPLPNSDSASPYPIIDSLVGRTEMVPMFVNDDGVEDSISPIALGVLFLPGVMRYQMHLLGPDSFRFLVCLDPASGPAQRAESIALTRERLRTLLDRKKMTGVIFEVVVVDDLPANPRSRKFQLVVDARGGGPVAAAAA
jgi:phenylacetate-CoA ligase